MNSCAKQITILLADDSFDIRHVIARLLKTNGFQVLVAVDGADALNISREFSGEIQILLADIEMPAMNGIELAERIRAERPETRVLLMSGYVSHEGAVASSQPFISKPFRIDELISRLEELLRRRVAAAPLK